MSMSYEKETIEAMKNAIIDLVHEEMLGRGSLDQTEILFLIAVGQAFKEIYENK